MSSQKWIGTYKFIKLFYERKERRWKMEGKIEKLRQFHCFDI